MLDTDVMAGAFGAGLVDRDEPNWRPSVEGSKPNARLVPEEGTRPPTSMLAASVDPREQPAPDAQHSAVPSARERAFASEAAVHWSTQQQSVAAGDSAQPRGSTAA